MCKYEYMESKKNLVVKLLTEMVELIQGITEQVVKLKSKVR